MKKFYTICLIAFMALGVGCAGLQAAIPTISVDVSDEAFDVNVNAHIDKSTLCVPQFLGDVPVLGVILNNTVGVCAEEGEE